MTNQEKEAIISKCLETNYGVECLKEEIGKFIKSPIEMFTYLLLIELARVR